MYMGDKRIKLDIGAITASPKEGGNFVFFLYRSGMDKCLAVPLTPPDMHAVLANFKQLSDEGIQIHNVFANVLREYRIEVLEIVIVKESEKSDFSSELLLFDGEKEFKTKAGFADGIIMAKIFGSPIYATSDLMEKYATVPDEVHKGIFNNGSIEQKLKMQLEEAVKAEDYEKAEKINNKINFLKNKSKDKF